MSTRYRVKKNEHTTGSGYLWYTPSGGSPFIWPGTSFSYQTSENFSDILDETHPGYFRRVRRGELIIGILAKLDRQRTSGGGTMTAIQASPANSWEFKGTSVTLWASAVYGIGATPIPQPPNGSWDDSALQAVSRIGTGEFSLMEDVLTMRQNLRFLGGPLKNIGDIAQRIRKNRGLPDYKDISNLWLTYRMEFLPSVSSIHDVLKGILTKGGVLNKDVRLRSTGKASWNGSNNSVVDGGSGVHYNYSSMRNLEAKTVVYYRLRQSLSDLAWRYGISFKDVPAGVWATIPYSFMIDRVINVSAICKALMNLSDPNIVIEGGCTTLCDTITRNTQLRNRDPGSGWTYTVAGDVLTDYTKTISRGAYFPSYSTISPQVNLSGLVKDATYTADLCALVLQRLGHR